MNKWMQISLLCLNLGFLQVNATCNWPTMNHDFQNTRSNPCENTLSTTNVANLQVKWAFNAVGGVQIAPIVYNGVVYFGDLGGNFYAKDANTGADVYASVNLGASCTAAPSISNSIIYITTNDLMLHALNLDLTPNATFNGGSALPVDPTAIATGQASVLSAPVIVNNTVIVGITNNESENTSVNMQLHGGFSAFNATTGAFLWRTAVTAANEGTAGGSWSTPAVDTSLGLIYVGTTNATTPPAGSNTDALIAIDYVTGDIIWSRQYTPNDVWGALYPCGFDYDFGASPNAFTIQQGDVIGGASKEGVYRVFRRNNGHFMWSTSLIPHGSSSASSSNPGAAYANGVVYAIANATNSTIPQGPLTILAFNGNASAFGLLFQEIAFNQFTVISALNAHNGHVLWTQNFPSATFASLTEANGVIYTGNFLGDFNALDADSGDVLFTTSLGLFNTVSAPITVTEGKVFIGTGIGNGGQLVVYSLP